MYRQPTILVRFSQASELSVNLSNNYYEHTILLLHVFQEINLFNFSFYALIKFIFKYSI
jgi:hypothetical protein